MPMLIDLISKTYIKKSQKWKKFSKKQQKCQKIYKKINQSQILYRIVFKLGAARFCKKFLHKIISKNAFCIYLHFLFSKITFFALKNSPPGENWIVL